MRVLPYLLFFSSSIALFADSVSNYLTVFNFSLEGGSGSSLSNYDVWQLGNNYSYSDYNQARSNRVWHGDRPVFPYNGNTPYNSDVSGHDFLEAEFDSVSWDTDSDAETGVLLSEYSDFVFLNNGDDSVYVKDDTYHGWGGDDLIYGGMGNDKIVFLKSCGSYSEFTFEKGVGESISDVYQIVDYVIVRRAGDDGYIKLFGFNSFEWRADNIAVGFEELGTNVLVPTVSIELVGSAKVALGGEVSFNSNVDFRGGTYNNVEYKWLDPDGSIIGSSDQLNVNNLQYSDEGTYRLQVDFDDQTVISQGLFLNVVPSSPPSVSISSIGISLPFRLGENPYGYIKLSAAVNSDEPASYAWYKNGNSLGAQLGSPSQPSTENLISGSNTGILSIQNPNNVSVGDYYVVVSNDGGSRQSNVINVSIAGDPVLSVSSNLTSVTQGDDVVLTANGLDEYFDLATIEWYQDGWRLNSWSVTHTVYDVSEYEEGVYVFKCETNAGDVIVSEPFQLRLESLSNPSILTHPSGQVVTSGDNVTLSVSASGGSLSYQWQKDGVNINGATSSSYTIAGVSTNDAGSYTVVVSNSAGSVTSNAADLTVQQSGPEVTAPSVDVQPMSQSVTSGGSVTLNVSASGGSLSYQWQKGGVDINGATSSSYTIASVSETDSGSYTVVVSNSAGSVNSNAADLTVQQSGPEVTAPSIDAQPTSQSVTSGDNVTLSVSASGGSLSYQWQTYLPPAGWQNIQGATSSSYTATYSAISDGGAFRVEISNSAGSVTSEPAQVIVADPSKSYTLVSTAVTWSEAKASAELEGGYLLEINSYGEWLSVVESLDDFFFAMSGEDEYFAFLDSTLAPDGGGSAYLWLGGSDAAVEGDWRWASSGEQFWAGGVSGSAVNGAFNRWGKTTQQNEPDNFNGSQNALALALETWPLFSGGTPDELGYAYEWNDISAENQLYFMIEKDLGGPEVTAPSIDAQPTSQSVTSGDNVTLSVSASGGSLSYQWQTYLPPAGWQDIAGETESSYTATYSGISDGGAFRVEISNSAGSVSSELVQVLVDDLSKSYTLYGEVAMTWSEAISYAQSQDGYLLEINSYGEWLSIIDFLENSLAEMSDEEYSNFLNNTVATDGGGSAYLWLGGSDAAVEGEWRWASSDEQFWSGGVGGAAVDGAFNRWGATAQQNEPDNFNDSQDALALALETWPYLSDGTEDQLGYAYEWNDISAESPLYFIIEQDLDGSGPPLWPSGFSPSDYLARYSDLAAAFGTDHNAAWEHYLNYGVTEGRTHSDSFSVDDYLSLNGDLAAAFSGDKKAALEHWFNYGINEGRSALETVSDSWPSGFSPSDYLARYSDLAAAFGTDHNAAWQHYLNVGVIEGLTHSVSFSIDDYLSLNPDVAAAFGSDKKAALEHWFNYGMNEGRQALVVIENGWPSGFSPSDYLSRYSDLAAAFGTDHNAAWEHYLNYGVTEGRTHSDSFSVDDYLSLNGDLAAAFSGDKKAALEHWFNYGINEGRSALETVSDSWPSGFSPSDYLARYSDLAAAFGTDHNAAWEHYLNYGVTEGRTHSDSFSVDDYLSLNGDLAAAFSGDKKAALEHWFNYGINEGRSALETVSDSWPSGFSPSDYLALNSDLAVAFGTDHNAAWEHYLNYGVTEGRTHSDSFSIDDYLSLNSDVDAAFSGDKRAALEHWFNYGINEGRLVFREPHFPR